MRRSNWRQPVTTLVVLVALVFGASGAGAADPGDVIAAAANGSAMAEPVFTVPDLVSIVAIVNDANELPSVVESRAITATQAAYGTWSTSRSASVPMHAVRRGPAVIQQAPDGYDIPMSTTALPTSTVAQLMGRPLAGVLTAGYVVMGRTTADLRGAAVGDALDLVSATGPVVQLIVGLIVDDDVIGGTEILMSTEQGERIGITRDTRILLWGFRSRELLEQTLAAAGLTSTPLVKIRHSWDPFDPDSELGMAETKVALGEFAYQVRTNSTDIDVTTSWVNSHMPPTRELYDSTIQIKARCNLAIRSDLRAALAEIVQAGLAGAIDVDNTNSFGGCYYPRFNRLGGQLSFLSRHSWGQALDTNTLTNPQGAAPTMNCDVVRIFRKHGFAWGGNFVTPDGMHFEWVGTRRDQYQYPSRYCPNLPLAPTTTPTSTPLVAAPSQRGHAGSGSGLDDVFASDAFAVGD